MLNKIQFKKAWELIEKSQDIFLTTHEGTDGDDLGSLLAVRAVLIKMGKNVSAAVNKGVPEYLMFLPGASDIGSNIPDEKFDLLITFGCNKIDRTGFDTLFKYQGNSINIDHHPDNTQFGTVNLVDADTAAVAELVYYFLKHNTEIEIDKDIATCLLTGIFYDTGGFKHANTSATVLEVSAALIKKGARIDKVAFHLVGKKRPETLRAWAKALENTRFDPDKQLVYSVLTSEDMNEIGATDEDLGGFVEFLNNIPQAKFVLLLRQEGDIVKGSLRSDADKKVDVSEIAKAFGGGGHKLASGFKIKGKLIKDNNAWRIE